MIKTNLDNATKEQKEKFFKELVTAHQILFDSVRKRLVTTKHVQEIYATGTFSAIRKLR